MLLLLGKCMDFINQETENFCKPSVFRSDVTGSTATIVCSPMSSIDESSHTTVSSQIVVHPANQIARPRNHATSNDITASKVRVKGLGDMSIGPDRLPCCDVIRPPSGKPVNMPEASREINHFFSISEKCECCPSGHTILSSILPFGEACSLSASDKQDEFLYLPEFENLYLYSKSLNQPTYKRLARVFRACIQKYFTMGRHSYVD
ncbi:hypothetical protein PR048_022933 [Dryococelus australis]|uniref:Uncharacterized protein n=1 Tax=Dryococelus australis TaxID=614101 RepID=A0ABQ9GSR2_9NEOP|nr:hypothetical protein PR048_022933 [Dryococelus australis]